MDIWKHTSGRDCPCKPERVTEYVIRWDGAQIQKTTVWRHNWPRDLIYDELVPDSDRDRILKKLGYEDTDNT